MIVAKFSQADWPGAERACTVIAVLACTQRIKGIPVNVEWCIKQGAVLYGNRSSYTHSKEIIDMIGPAVSVGTSAEHGGSLWTEEEEEAFVSLDRALTEYPAVLTVGAFSVAILSDCELMDSHPQAAHGNKAVLYRLENRQSMMDHLRQRFGHAHYSLCIMKEAFERPSFYDEEKDAQAAAAQFPGLLHVFRDHSQYVVAPLRNLYHYNGRCLSSKRDTMIPLSLVVQASDVDALKKLVGAKDDFTIIRNEEEEEEEEEHLSSSSVESMDLDDDDDDDDDCVRLVHKTLSFRTQEECHEFMDRFEDKGVLFGIDDGDSGYHVIPSGWSWEEFYQAHLPEEEEEEEEEEEDPYPIFKQIARDMGLDARSYAFAPSGVITYTLHDETEKVVDLKKKGVASNVSMVVEEDGFLFDSDSSTGQMIAGFAAALFRGSKFGVTFSQPVRYNVAKDQYEVPLLDVCHMCGGSGGTLSLTVTRSLLTIRCSKCSSAKGHRWERPSKTSKDRGQWDLSFLFPPRRGLDDGVVQRFLEEPNLVLALGSLPGSTVTEKLHALDDTDDDEVLRQKVTVVRKIFSHTLLEACYRECLAVAPDFEYPVSLIPQDPCTLAKALWMHWSNARGLRRTDDKFYVPTDDNTHYVSVDLDTLLTQVCSYGVAPNLFSCVFYKKSAREDLKQMLRDPTHFPSTPLSKRYLGYRNGVYDLEQNEFLDWSAFKEIPFNRISEQDFPKDVLEQAKAHCPKIRRDDNKIVFDGDPNFVATPMLDQPLRDQGFPVQVVLWLYVFLGRLFHSIGKSTGDNWEVCPFFIGVPGTFKSSLINLVAHYLEKSQFGFLATKVEPQFPLASVVGKLIIAMTECGGCTLEPNLLKQMVSGDPIAVNAKYKDSVNIPQWTIPVVFAGNSFLPLRDLNGSIERRAAVFPFTFVVEAGQGDTGLVQRIFEREGPQVLIKWNTLYLAVRRAVTTTVHPMLPDFILEATHQAIIENDSLRSFLAQECIITGEPKDCLSWPQDMAVRYSVWCTQRKKTQISVDLYSTDMQAMLDQMGVHLSQDPQDAPQTLVGIRFRNQDDPVFQSLFMAKRMMNNQREEDEEKSC